jgi:hypothetical protein
MPQELHIYLTSLQNTMNISLYDSSIQCITNQASKLISQALRTNQYGVLRDIDWRHADVDNYVDVFEYYSRFSSGLKLFIVRDALMITLVHLYTNDRIYNFMEYLIEIQGIRTLSNLYMAAFRFTFRSSLYPMDIEDRKRVDEMLAKLAN